MEVHQLLLYDYVGDMIERRAPYRDAHLERIRVEREAGRIVMSGPLGDPPQGAAIVFHGVEPDQVESFALEDPYVRAGLVTAWRVERWNVA
jgi:uncharacterized protein YciI